MSETKYLKTGEKDKRFLTDSSASIHDAWINVSVVSRRLPDIFTES